MKKTLLVALMLCMPSAAMAAPGSWGFQYVTVDSISNVIVALQGDPAAFRIVTATVTVTGGGTIGGAAPCEAATVYYLSDPSAIDLGPATSFSALDTFTSVYTTLLSAVLLDKEVRIAVIEGQTPGSCSVGGATLLAN